MLLLAVLLILVLLPAVLAASAGNHTDGPGRHPGPREGGLRPAIDGRSPGERATTATGPRRFWGRRGPSSSGTIAPAGTANWRHGPPPVASLFCRRGRRWLHDGSDRRTTGPATARPGPPPPMDADAGDGRCDRDRVALGSHLGRRPVRVSRLRRRPAGARASEPVSARTRPPGTGGRPGGHRELRTSTDLAIGGWRTVVDGPLEDGSITVDAVRNGTTCRAQVRAMPLGGIVRITVLYGAGCPFAMITT